MTCVKTVAAMAASLLLAGTVTAVQAQAKPDAGKREYDASCGVCHGADGRGNGSYVEFLKRSPPDLTQLQKRNGGVFPISRVYEVIDGAGVGHGTREMPIWGDRYRLQAAEHYVDMPYNDQAYVRTRILALVEYLSRLQAR